MVCAVHPGSSKKAIRISAFNSDSSAAAAPALGAFLIKAKDAEDAGRLLQTLIKEKEKCAAMVKD